MSFESEKLVVNQLPQPVRPPNSYDTNFNIPSTSYPPQNIQNSKPSNVEHPQQFNDHSYIHVLPPTMAKEEEEEEEEEGKTILVNKLLNRILGKYEKLQENIGEQIKLEEMLGKREVKSQSNTCSRGLQQPLEGGGSSEKLERFKIRTVVAEEVAEEAGKK